MGSYKLVLVRHGETEWNRRGLFTGWYDTPLSKDGTQTAEVAGDILKESGLAIKSAHTSVLARATETLKTIVKKLGTGKAVSTHEDWRLNDRHYGALTGMLKSEAEGAFGKEQVRGWRRGFELAPPPMPPQHRYRPCIVLDPRYKPGPPARQMPTAESLQMTHDRMLQYWNKELVPDMHKNAVVLVVGHASLLRVIVKYLEDLPDNKLMDIIFLGGVPFMYNLDSEFKAIYPRLYLGNTEMRNKAIEFLVGKNEKNYTL